MRRNDPARMAMSAMIDSLDAQGFLFSMSFILYKGYEGACVDKSLPLKDAPVWPV